jgi:hypothetical protein
MALHPKKSLFFIILAFGLFLQTSRFDKSGVLKSFTFRNKQVSGLLSLKSTAF